MSQTWEIVFKPDNSIEVRPEYPDTGTLRVQFDGSRQSLVTEPNGNVRFKLVGTLRIKSIPSGLGGSYEIPPPGGQKSS